MTKFLHHSPCESCGSRDNLAVYEDHTYCFGCRQYNQLNGELPEVKQKTEFKDMIDSIRIAEKAIGNIHYGGVKGEMRIFRRSLFIIKDIQKGDLLIEGVNVRSIRPGDGLHSRHMDDICGKKASRDIKLGTPVSWDMVVM